MPGKEAKITMKEFHNLIECLQERILLENHGYTPERNLENVPSNESEK